MRRPVSVLAAFLLAACAVFADEPGDFDHYLLALSWSPSWCETTGDAREAPACAEGAGHGFTLHGLWPQHSRGWPEFCASSKRNPSRAQTRAMADIMGSSGLAWYQWVKHGRCTGLSGARYLDLSRIAFGAVALPEPEALAGATTPAALAESLRALNPGLPPDGLVVTCRGGLALEVRICLTRALAPQSCAKDVLARACPAGRAVSLPPPR